MKKSKFVLGLSSVLTVVALVACGGDSSSAPSSAPVNPVENLTESSSSADVVLDSISSSSLQNNDLSSSSLVDVDLSSSSEALNSSGSNVNVVPGSSSSTITASCGTAVYTEKCIDTEFEGEVCAAVGCSPMDCFEEMKGMEAYSCNGGSVMICDGTRWQYTNCAKPIIESSSSVAANSSSSNIANSSSSEWRGGECINQEGDTRYDEMYEYECKNGKWKIIGYRPGACVGDMDCGTSNVSTEQARCKALTVDGVQVEGSACNIEDGYHKSENGCEFFCYGGKWEYTPPPM